MINDYFFTILTKILIIFISFFLYPLLHYFFLENYLFINREIYFIIYE